MKCRIPGQFILIVLLLSCQSPSEAPTQSLTKYVNPFIGTDGKGKTYPGATVPFGMVQLSPDNGRNGWDWISGYFYPDSMIAGFSHLHLTGTGAGDLYDISFMPLTGTERQKQLDEINAKPTTISTFSHDREAANPGYYEVWLEDYEVQVNLTATNRSGLQRYHFKKLDDPRVKLDLGYSRNWDETEATFLEVVNDSTVVGYRKSTGWARDQRVFFYSVFSKPIADLELWSEGGLTDVSIAKGKEIKAVFHFDLNAADSEVMVKTALSSVSIENAKRNLDAEQIGFDFEGVRSKAHQAWEEQLQKIKVETDVDNKVQFYTAMYHSMLAPVTFSDVNGEVRGADGSTYRMDYTRYSIFSLWDTFRAWHPLTTLIHQDRVPDMLQSLYAHYEESGKLPVWEFHGNETDMMLGYHAVPVMADAILKGLPGIDPEKTYKAMKVSAMQEEFQIDVYQEKGYVPHERASWNVSLTMEYAYDDWCIAQVAKYLNKEDDYQYFMERSLNYRNHYDPKTNFMRAKDETGNFKEPFDPLAYHPEDYTEANAWQYHWFAPHDIPGLIEMSGGENDFEMKLDSMFEVTQSEGESPVWISGYIGQYVHGNEPSHHVPYLYQYVSQPAKTQQRVRQIMDDLYTTDPDGLCGNEDCGQMSAWYLFSALGFYPVNPADGRYVLGSPQVDEAILSLPEGKQFKVIAKNQGLDHVYVQQVLLNGVPLDRSYITHEEVVDGGTLIFEMSNNPVE
ncbi:MAG: GH92 family glycosyl hydrolase [Cytophagales bacterium]|nr:GH92 family glycosyl hydrolase [Cytophagales bacterium]